MWWIIILWVVLGGLGGAFWWLKSFGCFEGGDWLVFFPSVIIGPLSWLVCMLAMQPWKWGSNPNILGRGEYWPGVAWKYKWDKPFWIK